MVYLWSISLIVPTVLCFVANRTKVIMAVTGFSGILARQHSYLITEPQRFLKIAIRCLWLGMIQGGNLVMDQSNTVIRRRSCSSQINKVEYTETAGLGLLQSSAHVRSYSDSMVKHSPYFIRIGDRVARSSLVQKERPISPVLGYIWYNANFCIQRPLW